MKTALRLRATLRRILFDAPNAASTHLVSFFISPALLQSNNVSFNHFLSNPGISAMICGKRKSCELRERKRTTNLLLVSPFGQLDQHK
jgi:hypothetical protein